MKFDRDLWRIELYKGECPEPDAAVSRSVGYPLDLLTQSWHEQRDKKYDRATITFSSFLPPKVQNSKPLLFTLLTYKFVNY